MDKAKIEKAALDVYSKHVKRGMPAASFAKIIKNEGLWFSEIESDNKDFLGALIKFQNDPLHLVVRSNILPLGRKNFTIAHELGHYVLNHILHGASIFCSNINEEDEAVSEQEDEANYFARCFLLPRERIIREFTNWFNYNFPYAKKIYLYVETHGQKWRQWKTISGNLTKQFGVSETALKIRLVELGLIRNFN